MSVTASNYHFCTNGWHSNRSRSMMIMTATQSSQSSQSLESANSGPSPNVDDGLTSLSWLQNLNMCMTRLGAPTPPTPPASPINTSSGHVNNTLTNISSHMDGSHTTSIQKVHTIYQSHREKSFQNGHTTSNKKMSQTNNESESIDYKTNANIKPPYSYATLICMAMKANKNKMTLSAIYKWIRENFMYYKNADPSWQNSIRHNLSLNKCFIKIPRNKDEPGKGGFWRLDPVYADTLVDGVFKKRRPCQRGSNSSANGTNAPFKKKSRKKDQLKNDSSISTAISDGKNGVTTIRDVTILHDCHTPPNSAEYYGLYGEPQSDVVELATAVSSIESIGHCPSYSYTMSTQSEAQLSNRAFDEVCVTTASTDTCMLETDGNDICWNAILTDADLGQLVDGVNYAVNGPVVNANETNLTVSDSTTTAQLTAVEPHSLHLVASVASASSNASGLDDHQLFQSGVSRHLNCLSANVGSDVISATHNVVTCVNPNVNSHDWHPWPTFSTVATHDNQSATTELLIRQIASNVNCEQITNGMTRPSHSPITYITTATIAARTHNGVKHINSNTNSVSSTQPDSPTSANFEHPNALQPWAECKAALEAAALDLESFADLESVHTY